MKCGVICRVSCDVQADVTCRGYAGIPQSVWATIKQGGTADRRRLFVPGRDYLCQGLFARIPEARTCESMCSPPLQAAAVLARSCGLQGWVSMCLRHMYVPRGATSTDAKHPEMRNKVFSHMYVPRGASDAKHPEMRLPTH